MPKISRGVLAVIAVGACFVAFSWTAKELPTLYLHEPWQDDPYDAVVSFAIVAVTMLTALIALRASLFRRNEILPARRAVDLLRAGRANLILVAATLASDWLSVAFRTHRASWTGTTTLVTGGLAAVTVLAAGAAVLVRSAGRVLAAPADASAQPDWAADGLEFGERAAARLGPWRPGTLTALRRIDTLVVARVRRHPVLAAGVLALLAGAFIDAPQIAIEGYPVSLAALFITISACSLFAFFLVVGAYLRLVGRGADHPAPATRVLVLVSLSVPLAASFRGSLWWLIGTSGQDAGLPQFASLVAVTAAITGLAAVIGELLAAARRHR
jgi:hypothetical protein